MSLKHKKELFNIPNTISYLNIAAQSPSFKTSSRAGIKALKQKSLPHTITLQDYFNPVTELRQLFAKIIDCDNHERIATCPSVSYGLANVANNIKLNQGDEIIVIEEQFPSNIYIWQKLAKKFKANIVTVKTTDIYNAIPTKWNADILDAISDKTALVAIGHIHWSNGFIFDLKAIRQKTTQHNALLIVDGSQSIGALPFSVKELQPDALVCAGYKWLFGPYGCAYAYFGAYFDNGEPIEENWSNRLESENFAKLTSYQSEYKPYANRYMMGENGNFIYVKMQIEALKQVLQFSPENLQSYCKTISEEAIIKLKNLGFIIKTSNLQAHHLFGIKLPANMDVSKIKDQLNKHQVFVSFRGDYIRVSCHYFNTKEDFDKLVNCMKSIYI